ncbi:hypothetical protein IAT38_004863 [Cryptococcus sp. DSM 104549]
MRVPAVWIVFLTVFAILLATVTSAPTPPFLPNTNEQREQATLSPDDVRFTNTFPDELYCGEEVLLSWTGGVGEYKVAADIGGHLIVISQSTSQTSHTFVLNSTYSEGSSVNKSSMFVVGEVQAGSLGLAYDVQGPIPIFA